MNKKLAYLYISLAAILWGIIGLFVSTLHQLGFSAIQIITVRVLITSFFLILYTGFKSKKLLRIQVKDSKYFIGTGIISFVVFNWCLFNAIRETSISIATILLYTAPAFVIALSRILLKEALTTRKILALIITLIGCAFVIGILPRPQESISGFGFLLGIGAGFFYALYSIFGKFALQKYDSLTVTVYTFVFAAIAITPFSQLKQVFPLFNNPLTWLNFAGLSLFSTMLAYILYTKGLTRVESSQASIIATLEPVVVSFISFLFFDEKLNHWQYLGMILVLAAVMLVQEYRAKPTHEKSEVV